MRQKSLKKSTIRKMLRTLILHINSQNSQSSKFPKVINKLVKKKFNKKTGNVTFL